MQSEGGKGRKIYSLTTPILQDKVRHEENGELPELEELEGVELELLAAKNAKQLVN